MFTIGIYVRIMAVPHIQIFGAYMCIMAFFHFSEFVTIAIIQPTQVTTASFVINHSPQYVVAAVTSWLEFFIESYLFPGKQYFNKVQKITNFLTFRYETIILAIKYWGFNLFHGRGVKKDCYAYCWIKFSSLGKKLFCINVGNNDLFKIGIRFLFNISLLSKF